MNIFNKKNLLYIGGAIFCIALFGYDKVYFLLLLGGVGLGLLLHNWIKGMYDDTINAFFVSELTRRQIKKKELEQELARLNEGD